MQHLELTDQYYISSFIAGLKEGIKHYLVPHNPQLLSDTYWQAKELEKGILVKKSLLSLPHPTPNQPHHSHQPHHPNPTNSNPTQPYQNPL
jgi:hypothetical protein